MSGFFRAPSSCGTARSKSKLPQPRVFIFQVADPVTSKSTLPYAYVFPSSAIRSLSAAFLVLKTKTILTVVLLTI